MKKSLSVILVSLLLTCVLFMSGSTLPLNENSTVTNAETAFITSAMNARNIGGDNIEIEPLYNSESVPVFLLGTSDSGYLIASRNPLECIESGELNPYSEHKDEKKFYGGLLNYYFLSDSGFIDILQKKETSNIPVSDSLLNDLREINSAKIGLSDSINTNTSVSYQKIIPYATQRIQRKAFGYNSDNTCTAIACTLILDYLDWKNSDIVPTKFHLENLQYDASPSSQADTERLYPKAHAFHRFLVTECGMGAATFGRGVASGLIDYRWSSKLIFDTKIASHYVLNINTNFGINELDADRPIMITSTIGGDYNFHTMAVYGYRWLSDGSLEWLVHTGWHTSTIKENGVRRMAETWASAPTATMLYKFTYEGM